MITLNQPLLINILGHAAGALIFGIFLALLFSSRGWSGDRGRNLSAFAATLSLLWNLGSLVALTWPGLSPSLAAWLVAISFSVLSLLPAVLLQISLERRLPVLVVAGYLLSATAAVMHFWEIRGHGAELHQAALLLITIGFLALTGIVVAAGIVQREEPLRPGTGRIAASMCLALFAMSFVHFGSSHAGQAWSAELVVHHAGIPLALFVLLQDYRFVLLDAFVRFMANALLAAVLTLLVIEAAYRLGLVERAPDPLQLALLLSSVCLFLAFFAWLRNQAQQWLTHVVFRRGNLDGLSVAIRNCPSFPDEESYMEWAVDQMGAAVRADRYATVRQDGGAPDWAEASIPLRMGASDSRLIVFGRRRGGQRYLGGDIETLSRAAGEITERVESLRRREMNRLVSQAELRALQSQINPHFLFNALNALYGAIPREASGARRMVINLADIFRYSLQTGQTFAPLEKEIDIVRAYLEVEQARLGDRLSWDIDIDRELLRESIPVLALQPLVENAVKHGIAARSEPGYVRVRGHYGDRGMRITVVNSAGETTPRYREEGVGLENVRRRLRICYGDAAGVRLSFFPDHTVAELCIPPLETAMNLKESGTAARGLE